LSGGSALHREPTAPIPDRKLVHFQIGVCGLQIDRLDRMHSSKTGIGMNIVDLSVPGVTEKAALASRSNSTRRIPRSCGWQARSTFSMFAHYGTHVDAPIHFIRDAAFHRSSPARQIDRTRWPH
jgi:hypothetical protein